MVFVMAISNQFDEILSNLTIHINFICIFARFKPKLSWVEGWIDIMSGVYLTLYSRCAETSQLSKSQRIKATVDAYGIYFGVVQAMLLYIGVGFVFACFDSIGNAKASVHGTSKESFHAFLFAIMRFLRQGRHKRQQGVANVLFIVKKTHRK